jgi:UDP-N-acetylglucosamine--N-acetylmuramyl-(pentapeptide) pyrophosphoryl-undecaprenol N-acetylglucosamine transferase
MIGNRYVFAGGGTGGHLFPGLAVADALRRRDPGAEITFFTTTRALDRQLLETAAYGQIVQPVRPFTLHPLRFPAFWWSWHESVRAARAYLRKQRPRAVLGLGGYAAGPPVVAARKLGIRTAILNPDAIPGRANRHLAQHADLVVLQWEVSRACFPDGTNCQVLGCPIRGEFAAADGARGRRRFELDPHRPLLLVTGASQGAHTVNLAVLHTWPDFHAAHPDWQLLHLTGPADEAEVRAAYAAAECPAHVLGFTHEMPLALAAADLVIARAGASTLAELAVLSKPSILLPYPYHRDRHQHANARVLVDRGAARLLDDRLRPELNAPPLRAGLDALADLPVRKRMAEAAGGLGKPRAADDVAAWLAA